MINNRGRITIDDRNRKLLPVSQLSVIDIISNEISLELEDSLIRTNKITKSLVIARATQSRVKPRNKSTIRPTIFKRGYKISVVNENLRNKSIISVHSRPVQKSEEPAVINFNSDLVSSIVIEEAP